HWHFDQVLLRIFDRFTDCIRNLLRFPCSKTDAAVFISDNDKCCEAETTSTLYHFRYAVDRYYAFFEFTSILIITTHEICPSFLMKIPVHFRVLRLQELSHGRGIGTRHGRKQPI